MANSSAIRLKAEGLQGQRGDKILFANLSFTVQTSELLVLSGANGTGKSTLLRIIAGLCPPASGAVALESAGGKSRHEPQALPLPLFSHYLSDKNAMKPQLSVAQNLLFWHVFLSGRENKAQNSAAALRRALRAVNMESYAELPFAALSTGQKRRVGFCRLLLAPRLLWLLDEPTSGLDSAGAALFAALCERHLRGGGMILAATHLPLGLKAAHSVSLADYRPQNPYARCDDFLDLSEAAAAKQTNAGEKQ